MTILLGLSLACYAFINAFGAWMVIRRKPWIGWLFMLAAAALIVAAASVVAQASFDFVLVCIGATLASATSLLNAHFVLGDIIPRNHLVRGGIGLGLCLLAYL